MEAGCGRGECVAYSLISKTLLAKHTDSKTLLFSDVFKPSEYVLKITDNKLFHNEHIHPTYLPIHLGVLSSN